MVVRLSGSDPEISPEILTFVSERYRKIANLAGCDKTFANLDNSCIDGSNISDLFMIHSLDGHS